MFFDDEELETSGAGCFACKLWRKCNSPRMKATGEGKRGILFIGESPSAEDDATGIPFSGRSGRLLGDALFDMGIDLDKDCRRMHSISCHIKTNRAPTSKEIEYCRSMIWQEIKEYPPKIIVLLGITSVNAVIGSRWTQDIGPLSRWAGLPIPDKRLDCWFFSTFHPAQLISNPDDEALLKTWVTHLKNAVKYSEKKIPKDTGVLPQTIHYGFADADRYLKELIKNNPEYLAFDIETNCLRPRLDHAQIYSISFATDSEVGVAMLTNDCPPLLLNQILSNEKIKKIASNLKFEHRWLQEVLGIEVKGWWHDTMVCSHVEDNRPFYSGLKFQVYSLFGIPDYNKDVESYIKTSGSNQINNIDMLSTNDLLEYNALDSVFEFKVAMRQRKRFK